MFNSKNQKLNQFKKGVGVCCGATLLVAVIIYIIASIPSYFWSGRTYIKMIEGPFKPFVFTLWHFAGAVSQFNLFVLVLFYFICFGIAFIITMILWLKKYKIFFVMITAFVSASLSLTTIVIITKFFSLFTN